MIEVQGLSKSYGSIHAIQDIHFSVKKGEVVGFLGPNGAGKSTTMKIITGSMAPSAGQVRVAGFDVFEDPIAVKKRIGYLPETPPVYADMSVADYLDFVARLKGVERALVRSRVERAIERTDLGPMRRRLIGNLSKGYTQRVGIAQALVSEPEVLILDEPTSGLDPRQVAEVRALIHSIKGEQTIILSTHILPEVQAMCERIIIINGGRIVAEDTLDGLSRRMSGSHRALVKVSRPSAQIVELLRSVAGVSGLMASNEGYAVDYSGGNEVLERLASTVVSSGAGLVGLRDESANLEEIFLKLTSSKNSSDRGVA